MYLLTQETILSGSEYVWRGITVYGVKSANILRKKTAFIFRKKIVDKVVRPNFLLKQFKKYVYFLQKKKKLINKWRDMFYNEKLKINL